MFKTLLHKYSVWRIECETIERLSFLDERQLGDVGIPHDDIEVFVANFVKANLD